MTKRMNLRSNVSPNDILSKISKELNNRTDPADLGYIIPQLTATIIRLNCDTLTLLDENKTE